MRNGDLQDLSFLVGAGSVVSTARDLFLFSRAVVEGKLGESARASLLGADGIDWNGSTNGFRAFLDYHPKSDLTVVLTANLQSGANDRIREVVSRIANGLSVEPELPPDVEPVALAPEVLARFEGVYELRPGALKDLTSDGRCLYLGSFVLVPRSATTFFSPQDYARVEAAVEGGAVQALEWNGMHIRRVGPLVREE